MAKKKSLKTNRKHQLKYAAPTSEAAPGAPVARVAKATVARTSSTAEVTTQRDFSYVRADLVRIVFLGGGLILVLIIMWFLFGHTGIGPAVYNLIKV